jgi:four helix bundle protein
MASATSKPDAAIISQAKEASRARSDSEFCSKLDGLLQEADESQPWLELLDCGIQGEPIDRPFQETGELMGILITMVSKLGKAENLKR